MISPALATIAADGEQRDKCYQEGDARDDQDILLIHIVSSVCYRRFHVVIHLWILLVTPCGIAFLSCYLNICTSLTTLSVFLCPNMSHSNRNWQLLFCEDFTFKFLLFSREYQIFCSIPERISLKTTLISSYQHLFSINYIN